MLIQYHKISNNDPNRIQLLSMIFCEIILLIFELFEFAAIIFNMSRYQFHFNLKVVVGYAIFAYWFDIIARITIAFFEIGLFNLDDQTIAVETEKLPWNYKNMFFMLLFCCSTYRVYFMFLICSVTLLLAVERFLATIWVSTYESVQHKWVSIVLTSTNSIAGIFGSLLFHYELIFDTAVWCSLGLCFNFVSIFLYVILFNSNKSKIELCQTREITQSYTLSLRFQLNENLKIMNWIKNSILVVTCFNTLLAGFLIASNNEYLKNDYPVLVKCCHTFLNLGIAIYAQVVFFVAILADRHFRTYFLRFKPIRVFTKPFFGRIFPEDFKIKKILSTSDETNVYFSKLSLQWDEQIIRSSHVVVAKKKRFWRV
ncbi:Serpentine receptor class epsilon-2 [Caenorhabditis elegans]|uniref:Serpentine receptor class epsilon-2 n=1 Tax=Caenorhabditis elegans TaxID=6239 RepID=SRE2_CAEEL|nr:Serpentine receptor class epsilon-2 [Caenorhabditis elegans]Q09273.4 RecName: Full=Serpentine receptor class epsilon-2; Short=Protein sre-2 [Caenorhabditis elegans]CAA88099.5 Serpentine receptor class epsilon-2 [Caenorhabditis elegans]|eukprot:NP_495698.4 Serpentine receptor class epsilon-2 [Caenorhabditis elegans]